MYWRKSIKVRNPSQEDMDLVKRFFKENLSTDILKSNMKCCTLLYGTDWVGRFENAFPNW